MVAEGLLNPREGIFTAKERDILAILARCDAAEMDVVKAYLAAAKMLAEKEKALSALSDIRISVSRQCFCAFISSSRG